MSSICHAVICVSPTRNPGCSWCPLLKPLATGRVAGTNGGVGITLYKGITTVRPPLLGAVNYASQFIVGGDLALLSFMAFNVVFRITFDVNACV